MDAFMDKIIGICTEAGGKIILALLIFIIGKAIIKKLLKLLTKGKGYQKMDATVQSFFMNFAKIALYVVLRALRACHGKARGRLACAGRTTSSTRRRFWCSMRKAASWGMSRRRTT